MSDHILTIIPETSCITLSKEQMKQSIQYLSQILQADNIEGKHFAHPEFIDCGQNLEHIHCPQCHQKLSFEWWSQEMDHAYQHAFQNLSISMPCCGKTASLDTLHYDATCGFARTAIVIWNPNDTLSTDQIQQISRIFHSKIKLIASHL